MKKTKLGVLIISIVVASTMLGAISAMGIYIPPIEDPPIPPPPSGTDIRGYVKISGTSTGILGARVALYGYKFVIDMYKKVLVGERYTSSSGYYSFLDITEDSPYSIIVSKNGYITYSGSYKYTTYLSPSTATISVSGTVKDDDTINNIQVPNANPVNLDITPDGLAGYDHTITTATTYVKIQDYTGTVIKTVACSSSTGAYSTESFEIKKGTIKITAYTSPGYYTPKTITKTISSSIALTGQNFNLERNLGPTWVYGDNFALDNIDNFKIKPHDFPDYLDFDFYAQNAPTMVYNPFNSQYTDYWFTTHYRVQTIQQLLVWYSISKAKVSLYADNLWTDDESFISLASVGFESNSYGSGWNYQWSFSAGLGWDPTPGGLSAGMQVGVSITPPSSVDVDPYILTEHYENGWKKLGYVEIDYFNDVTSVYKELTLNWQLQLNNGENPGELFTLRQCGSNINFKVVYEFEIKEHLFFWALDASGWYNYLTIEQIIGDNQLNYPTFDFWNAQGHAYEDYIAGTQSGRDYYTCLLAGESSLLPI